MNKFASKISSSNIRFCKLILTKKLKFEILKILPNNQIFMIEYFLLVGIIHKNTTTEIVKGAGFPTVN